MFVSVLELTIAPTVSAIYSFKAVPSTVYASASSVPSISASPLISNVAASSSPVSVIFPCAAVFNVPAKSVEVNKPLEGLYVKPVSDSAP